MRAQRLVILLLATGAAASRFGASLQPAQSHELLQSSLKNARPQAQLGNPNAGSPTSDAPRSPADTRYAVVVDCGSSGTRAIVYSWPANVSSSAATDIALGVRPLRAPDGRPLSKRIRPGLASVRRNPNEASDYMQPIMRFAADTVPRRAQPETIVYFLATAGLRTLTDQEQRDILDDLGRDLAREFAFKQIRAEVIDGAQEGAYRWLATNWAGSRLSRHFDQDQRQGLASFLRQGPRARRFGIIEMGGASAQVAFEATPPLADFVIKARLNPRERRAFERSLLQLSTMPAEVGARQVNTTTGNRLEVFSTTFLNFGSDSARELATDLLVRDAIRMPNRLSAAYGSFAPFVYAANSSFIIEDPCLPLGASESLAKPATLLYDQSRTIGFTMAGGGEDDSAEPLTLRLIGRGSHFHCRNLLERVVQLAKREQTVCGPRLPPQTNGGDRDADETVCAPATLLGSQFVPWRQLQFLGLGDLYYTTEEILRASGRFNGPQIQASTVRVCATDYETLRRRFPGADQFDSKRTLLECFKATWLLVWLQSALLVPMKHLADLRTVAELDGNELDWTLGALIERLTADAAAAAAA